MQADVKFSVLLSLYFKEKPEYLHECLESLITQTLLPNEIVIVFDGPLSFELESIVENLKTEIPLKILRLEENVGLGKALNLGLKICSYSYVARMDTDDICRPDRFEKKMCFLLKNPDVSMLGSSINEFDGELKREKKLPLYHQDIINYSKMKNPFNHMSVIFKKESIKNVGGYRHHLYMEDYNLWLRLLHGGFLTANLNESLLDVRVGNSMIEKRKGSKYLKSEVGLYKLKKNLGIDQGWSLYFNFVIRFVMRLLPIIILSKVYEVERGGKNKIK